RLFDGGQQPIGEAAVLIGAVVFSAGGSDGSEPPKNMKEEPGQPDALAPSFDADEVHAVVPVAGADEWKSVRSALEVQRDRANAVFVEWRNLTRDSRTLVGLVLPRVERTALE